MVNASGILKTLLSADAGVSAHIGSKIYAVKLPQDTALPAVVVSTVSVSPLDSKDGGAETDVIRLQISIYAASYKKAWEIDRAIRDAIDGYDGNVTAGLETWTVKDIRLESVNDVFEPEKDIFHRAADYVMMASISEMIAPTTYRWELEDGSGFWQLEDASGYWLQEAA